MTCDAKRDIEHFESNVWHKGKRRARRAMYADDQMRQGIKMNLEEV